MKPKMELHTYDGPTCSIGIHGLAQGTLTLTEDGRFMMIDDVGNEMPLGNFLRKFSVGSQPVRIVIDNLYYLSSNNKKTLFP